MSNALSTLNNLIETLKDGQQGFQQSAANVQSSDLKKLFGEYALQRSKFAGELQELTRTLGEHDPENSGSVAGAIHRGWINLKGSITQQDDHAILAECERGEDSSVSNYQQALEEEGLPAEIGATIRKQSVEIQAAHDRIRDLRDATAAAR